MYSFFRRSIFGSTDGLEGSGICSPVCLEKLEKELSKKVSHDSN